MQEPHPLLRGYYETAADRSAWVRDIFDRTAADYDRVERVLGLGSGSRYRRQALRAAGLKLGMTVLDIGAGTGLVAREAATIVGDPGLAWVSIRVQAWSSMRRCQSVCV